MILTSPKMQAALLSISFVASTVQALPTMGSSAALANTGYDLGFKWGILPVEMSREHRRISPAFDPPSDVLVANQPLPVESPTPAAMFTNLGNIDTTGPGLLPMDPIDAEEEDQDAKPLPPASQSRKAAEGTTMDPPAIPSMIVLDNDELDGIDVDAFDDRALSMKTISEITSKEMHPQQNSPEVMRGSKDIHEFDDFSLDLKTIPEITSKELNFGINSSPPMAKPGSLDAVERLTSEKSSVASSNVKVADKVRKDKASSMIDETDTVVPSNSFPEVRVADEPPKVETIKTEGIDHSMPDDTEKGPEKDISKLPKELKTLAASLDQNPGLMAMMQRMQKQVDIQMNSSTALEELHELTSMMSSLTHRLRARAFEMYGYENVTPGTYPYSAIEELDNFTKGVRAGIEVWSKSINPKTRPKSDPLSPKKLEPEAEIISKDLRMEHRSEPDSETELELRSELGFMNDGWVYDSDSAYLLPEEEDLPKSGVLVRSSDADKVKEGNLDPESQSSVTKRVWDISGLMD